MKQLSYVRLLFRADAAFGKKHRLGQAAVQPGAAAGDSAPANTAYGVAFPEAHRLLQSAPGTRENCFPGEGSAIPLLQWPRHRGAIQVRPEPASSWPIRSGWSFPGDLGNSWKAFPEAMKHWSLTSLQTRMIKTGGRLVRLPEGWCFSHITGMLEDTSKLNSEPAYSGPWHQTAFETYPRGSPFHSD